MPKVSVIVPVYKVEKYLNRCVDSILAQTFTDFELILVDDGSPDNCPKICDEYAEKDERVGVIHKENGGVSSARNDGIDMSQGEWIMFVDSDDWIEEDMLEGMVAKIKDDVDMVISSADFIGPGENEKTSATMPDSRYLSKEIVEKKFNGELPSALIDVPWCKLYKREVIIRENIKFDISICTGEDAQFNAKYLSYIKNVETMKDSYYRYIREGNDSLSLRFYENFYQINKKVYSDILEYAIRTGCSEETQRAIKVRHMYVIFAYWTRTMTQASREIAIRYMENMSEDDFLKENLYLMGRNSKYYTGKLVATKRFKEIYVIYKIKKKIEDILKKGKGEK